MPIYDEGYWVKQQEYEIQQAEYYFALYQQEQEEMKKYPLFFWKETCKKEKK